VLSADSTAELEREYADMAKRQKDGLNDAQRYGQALAVMRGGRAGAGRPGRPWPACCRPARTTCGWRWAWARPNRGRPAQANSRFEQLLREHPNSRPVALTYAEILNEQGSREAGQRAQAMLRPCCRKAVTIRSSSSDTPAPANWPATACAPARPMPRPPSSAAARNSR
jgi:hypothetical protein